MEFSEACIHALAIDSYSADVKLAPRVLNAGVGIGEGEFIMFGVTVMVLLLPQFMLLPPSIFCASSLAAQCRCLCFPTKNVLKHQPIAHRQMADDLVEIVQKFGANPWIWSQYLLYPSNFY